jgi:hypothetical protein
MRYLASSTLFDGILCLAFYLRVIHHKDGKKCMVEHVTYSGIFAVAYTFIIIIYIYIYIYYRLSAVGKHVNKGIELFPFWLPLKHGESMKLSVSHQFLNLGKVVGLFGRVISSSQDLYLHRTTQT